MPSHTHIKRRDLKQRNERSEDFPYPEGDLQMLARVEDMLGGGRVRALCSDNVTRISKIRGSHRRRMWIAKHDIILVSLRDFDMEKADILYKYGPTQVSLLRRHQILPAVLLETPRSGARANLDDEEGDDNYVDFEEDDDIRLI